MKISLINAEQTLELRHKILRPQQSLKDCVYPSDRAIGTFHIGVMIQERLVGISSFNQEKFDGSGVEYRLRGMATAEAQRGLGIGREMIRFAIKELRSKKADLLWCNAREVAFGFYLKMGFVFRSELFDIEGIGPHKVMSTKI